MNPNSDKLVNFLAAVPVIIMTTFANMLIALIVSAVIFLQLVSVYGWNRVVSLVTAILIAIAVHVYIWFQPKIRDYISRRSQ